MDRLNVLQILGFGAASIASGTSVPASSYRHLLPSELPIKLWNVDGELISALTADIAQRFYQGAKGKDVPLNRVRLADDKDLRGLCVFSFEYDHSMLAEIYLVNEAKAESPSVFWDDLGRGFFTPEEVEAGRLAAGYTLERAEEDDRALQLIYDKYGITAEIKRLEDLDASLA